METKYKEQEGTIDSKRKKIYALQNKLVDISKQIQQQQQRQAK